MSMTKKELETKIEEIRKYKTMIEEASSIEIPKQQFIMSYESNNK